MQALDPGRGLEHFRGQMRQGPYAIGTEGDLARLGLGHLHQLGHTVHRQRLGVDQQHIGVIAHHPHVFEFARIVRHMLVQDPVDGHDALAGFEQGIAVGGTARQIVGGDVAPGASTILDHHRLA